MTENYIIGLNGLPSGKTEFSWKAGKEFFTDFENTDIIDAELLIEAVIEKSGNYTGVDMEISGKVTVPCDRCLENLDIPVEKDVRLSVKFGEEPSETDSGLQDGEREIVWLPDSSADLDLSQTIYDYACLEIPMQRVHEDGQCNPDALKYLKDDEDGSPAGENTGNNPFAGLKDLLDN